ncbi:MAG: hypothetical protein GIKADHBN_01133 [Phycisphaerales bacterium]|nr:hypothetical protein [Phycisphaerales bacterium]
MDAGQADRNSSPDGRLDVTDAGSVAAGRNAGRPFLQVFFRCANKYLHVPRSADGSGYRAMCPLCGKRVNFVIGPGGTPQRFFEISC